MVELVLDSTVVVDVVEELVIDDVEVVSDETVDDVEDVEVWDVSEVEMEVVDSVVVTEVSVVDCAVVIVDAELVLSVFEEGIDVVVNDVSVDSMDEVAMEVESVGISLDVSADVVAMVWVDSAGAVDWMVSVET